MCHNPEMNFHVRFAFALIATLGLAAFATTGFAADEKEKKPAEAPKISAEEFDKMRDKPDTVILDVRTTDEFAAGHVPKAVNLPINDPQFKKKLEALDKGKTYLVHCAKGVRSERACKMMNGGFKSLFDFSGGFEAWKNAGKPIEKPAAEKKKD